MVRPISGLFNLYITLSFPDTCKPEKVKQQKGSKIDLSNYKTTLVLSFLLSKIFERVVPDILCNYQTRFRKNHPVYRPFVFDKNVKGSDICFLTAMMILIDLQRVFGMNDYGIILRD